MHKYLEVLEDILLPSWDILYPEAERNGPIMFVQDNSPIHKSRQAMRWFEDHHGVIELIPWPAKSADLNPIENIWGHMVKRWNDGFENIAPRPRTIEELRDHTTAVWEHLRGSDICQNLIQGMRRRLTECIEANGFYTRF